MTRIIFFVLITLSLLSLSCTSFVADDEGQGGGIEIIAKIHDQQGKPVEGANIYICESTYLFPPESLHTDILPNGISNKNGESRLVVPSSGVYTIEANLNNKFSVSQNIDISNQKRNNSYTLTLEKGAQVNGKVTYKMNTPKNVYIRVQGLRKITKLSNMNFTLNNVPSGNREINILSLDNMHLDTTIHVSVNSSDTTTLPNVKIHNDKYTLENDTLTVAHILSINGISDPLATFITIKNNRVTELSITHKDLSIIPDTICMLNNLQTLNLEHNIITTLPRGIGKLKSLKEINLFKNRLETLPEEITELSPEEKQLNVNQNKLHNLSTKIVTWIDKYTKHKNWKNTQK